MPTKTEQSDLLAAIFGSHGDYVKVVLSVANVIDCFYAPSMVRYLAEKLRLPVFLLSDFQTANSYKVIDKPKPCCIENVDDLPDHVFERFHINRLPSGIEMVRNNQSKPGTEGGMRRVTGLNTDGSGHVNYFGKISHRSHQVRNEKIHLVQRALKAPEMFGPAENDLLIVGWGSTRGAVEEAINMCQTDGVKASGMHLKIVYPLPLMLKDIFSKFDKIMTVELAYGDKLKPSPLAFLLRNATLVDIQPLIAEATGRPLQPRRIVATIKELLK